MGLSKSAILHARHTAAKYIEDIGEISDGQLITAMEQRAYELARSGATSEARSLLVLVAELELSSRMPCTPTRDSR